MREQAAVSEIPVDVAYQAAEERAVRTTKALILAEAQVLTLSSRVRELEGTLHAVNLRLAAYEEQQEQGESDAAYD